MKGCNKILKLFAGLLPILVLASCVKEHDITTPGGKEETSVRFVVQLPGSSTPSASSRAISETDENTVDEIDVLVFMKNGGRYVHTRQGKDITTDNGNSRIKTFTVELKQGEYDLVVLANSRTILSSASLDGKSKSEVLTALATSLPSGGKWPAASSATFKPFPMWGDIGTATINENTDFTGNDRVRLTRMVARVDVTITDLAAGNFKLTSVDVYNYNTHGSLVPKTADWDASNPDAPKATAPNVPSASTLTVGPLEYNNTEIDVTNNKCFREIYLFEAENHTDAAHAAQKGLTDRTCLVIGGVWDANGDGDFTNDGDPTYYRVDFSKGNGVNQQYIDIIRNHWYQFKITKVSGKGHEDSETAYLSEPFNIEAEVLEWNDGSSGEYHFDGRNYLSIKPETVFNFFKDADSETVRIQTDVPEGWKIIKITEADGTTVNSGWLTTDKTIDTFYGMGEVETTVSINVSGNDIGNPRTGYIYIKAGRLEARLTVIQSNESRFGIKLTDEQGNEISGLFFTANPSQAQRVFLSFAPDNAPLDVDISHLNTNYTPMDLTTYGDEPVSIAPGGSNGYEAYDFLPAPFPADELDPGQGGDPFLMKTARINFEVTHPANGMRAMASLYVYQRSPNLTTVQNTINAVFTGATYSIDFKTNADWEVEFGGDSPHIATAVTPTSGGASTGQQVFKFSVPYDLDAAATSFTVIFKSPTGEFADKTVTVNVEKPTLSINPTSASFTYAAHGAVARNTTFTITTNIPFDQLNIERSGAAITNHSANSTTKVVTVNVAAATSSQTTGTVTVKAGQMTATFNVTRGARPGTNFNGVYMGPVDPVAKSWANAERLCGEAGGRLPTVQEYKQAAGTILIYQSWFPGWWDNDNYRDPGMAWTNTKEQFFHFADWGAETTRLNKQSRHYRCVFP